MELSSVLETKQQHLLNAFDHMCADIKHKFSDGDLIAGNTSHIIKAHAQNDTFKNVYQRFILNSKGRDSRGGLWGRQGKRGGGRKGKRRRREGKEEEQRREGLTDEHKPVHQERNTTT